MFSALVALVMSSTSAHAFGPLCSRYMSNQLEIQAIRTIASNLQYTTEELCNPSRILDVQITHTQLYDENQQPIPHTWLTLHYNEYSCQYFVRDSDQVVTKKECYNTF